ncbi:MAG TPA: CoA transferase [Candidatus Margulisiibacteriota bacterium]|nr:CoA transferase [Candidatus Margulisiibacteriota bacterium]
MAFRHLTVVDLATLAAAPQIAAFFGDFGARVIKVEHPRGDSLRRIVDRHGTALQWKIVNRNKQCITLDLTKAAGRDLLDTILGRSDLLVCALNRDRLVRWGLDPHALAQRHPRLVVVNLTAYGTTGPWADRPGSGTLAEAMSGLAALTGPPDAPPTLSPVGLGDYLGVLQGIIAALLGLYGRDAPGGSGRGEQLDVAMYEPLLGLLAQRVAAATRDGIEPGRHGNRFPTVAPRNTYRTADGAWVALTAGTDDLVRKMFHLFGRPELCDDPRFRDNLARVAHVEELDAIIAAWIGARPCDEVVEQFNAAGVSLAAVDGLLRVAANPQFRARGSLIEVGDAEAGTLTTAAPSPARAQAPGRIRHLGRGLGADNRAVYCDWLGLSDTALARLQTDGII